MPFRRFSVVRLRRAEEDEIPDEAGYRRQVRDHLTANYIAQFVHGVFGMTGFRLILAPTFVPAYLFVLTESVFVVGLGQALLQMGAVVSPIVGASAVEHRRRVLPVAISIGWMMRVAILGLGLSGILLEGRWQVLSCLFFLALFGYYLGAQRVAFQMLMAKVIPVERRGGLQAGRNLLGGAVAALLSYYAGREIIERNVLGNGYAATFLISFVLTTIGLSVLYVMIREPNAPVVAERQSVLRRIRQFPDLLRHRSFRFFVSAQMLLTNGRVAMPFATIYAAEVVELDGTTLGLLSLVFLGSDTLANLVWGRIGDKRGYRAVMIGTGLLWTLGMALILSAGEVWQVLLAFAAFGAGMSGFMIGAPSLALEFGSAREVPMRLALSTSAETSMAAIGPLLFGGVAAMAGLTFVFVLTAMATGAALVVLLRCVEEPRAAAPHAGRRP
ncbi:MFS transporter [Parvularcula maris]|uniref:MFS transporter n=1 Tax=Parvularcula maris TaxID=2965077 RepID=A0A9X2LDE2_9PROT|nr:MFS transporter [Parvularcula maris]MCQ8186472.1 MFS transporter [Parvularcula maris]